MTQAQLIDSSDSSTSPNIEEEGRSRRGIVRAAGLIGLGNIASRVLGLVRTMVITAQFGSGPLTDAFFIASQVPTIIYDLLIGGLLSSALVPVFSEYATHDDDNRSLWELAGVVVAFVGLLLALFTLLVILFAPWITLVMAGGFEPPLRATTTLLIRVVAPSILFFGFSGVLTGLLYALKRFTFVAFAAAIFNTCIIFGALVLSRAFEGEARILGLAFGLLLGSVLQLALLLPDLRDVPLSPRLTRFWRNSGLRQIGLLYVPVSLSLVVSSMQIVIDRRLASGIGEHGVISWMQYATTLIQFPLGLVAAAVSLAVLPYLSRLAALNDWSGYRETLQMGLRLVLVLIVPATVGLWVLAEPIVRLLFERGEFVPSDTVWTALALRLYLFGLTFTAIDQLLIVAFYSRQDTWTPALVGIAAIGVYLLVALPFVGQYGMVALVLANAAQHFSHAVVMLTLLHRRFNGLAGSGMRSMVPRTLLAAAGMGAAVWLVVLWMPNLSPGFVDKFLDVLVPALAGVGSYIFLVWLFRIEEGRQAIQLLLRKARPL